MTPSASDPASPGATIVPGFRHTPGNHCGSTALRNMLAFHGTAVSEEMAFGLGAGACFFYVTIDGQSPSRFTNGRSQQLERDFLELTGTPFRMREEPDPERSWAMARNVVDSGRPALLLTDLYHLDHYGKSAHFPGHAVVLAGYDAEQAYLSDTGFEELQTTTLENLALARHSGNPIFPLAGHMVDLPPGEEIGDLSGAIDDAIARSAREMLEPTHGDFQGMPALERFALEVGSWPEVASDWQWCARFLFQVIERRGTGGGNFRAMYSRFLGEAGREGAALAAEAAGQWTQLAEAARSAGESDEPQPGEWSELRRRAEGVRDLERAFWTTLAD